MAVVAIVVLAGCERADPVPAPRPPAPVPVTDPVAVAQAQFEPLPAAFAVGTHKLYSRSDFLPDAVGLEGFDDGDFIGRLRALFGPTDDDEYVLRDRQTGFVITAYSGRSGPSYGGGPVYRGALPAEPLDPMTAQTPEQRAAEQAASAARRAIDPIIVAGDPLVIDRRFATTLTAAESADRLRKYQQFERHFNDAQAPTGFPAVAARLDALISAVRPVDWEAMRYDEDTNTIARVGVRHGTSFTEPPTAAAGEAYLLELDEAERGPLSFDDEHALEFYAEHAGDLVQLKPRVLQAWNRFAARIARLPPADRDASVTLATRFGQALGLTPAVMVAAMRPR